METQSIHEKWKGTGLLNGIKSESRQKVLSTILENQRVFNETIPDEDDWAMRLFKRNSIPIIVRLFNEEKFLPWKLVSIQSLSRPTGYINYLDKYGNKKVIETASKTRFRHAYFPIIKVENDTDTSDLIKGWGDFYVEKFIYENMFNSQFSQMNLDNESEMSLSISAALSEEITQEILGDLIKNCKTKVNHTWKTAEHFSEAVSILRSSIVRASNKNPNWIVTSEEFAKELSLTENTLNIKVYTHSSINDLVLMGYKGSNDADSAYQYSSYIPLVEMEGVNLRPGVTRKALASRYAKRLMDAGQFASMTVEGFQPTTSDEAEEVKNV